MLSTLAATLAMPLLHLDEETRDNLAQVGRKREQAMPKSQIQVLGVAFDLTRLKCYRGPTKRFPTYRAHFISDRSLRDSALII